ncbi:MAG: PAS domain-containing sensor histidine kinase [Haloferacaceae archaeon]
MDGTDESLPLAALVETVTEGLFVLAPDGRIVWTNDAFLDLVGGADDDPTGRPFASLFGDAVDEATLDAIATDETGPAVIRPASHADAYEVDVRPLADGRGVGWLRDVSARYRREREIERYRTILDTVDDTVYMLDGDRRFTWINAAAERMFGYDRETFVGRHLFEFLTDEQIETSRRNVEYLLADETPSVITFEMEPERKDGTTFPAETRATTLPGEEFTGTVGIIRDVSDRKERERELERQNDRLEEFASLVSHDLRNPLNVAEGRLELARKECSSDHLDALGDAHERMERLIEDLLTLARSGESVTDVTAVDLAAAVEDSWQGVKTDSATLVSDTTCTIHADGSRLRRLLDNLVRNAVEHGSTGGRTGSDDPVEHGATSGQSRAADAPGDGSEKLTVTVGDLDDGSGFYVEDDGPGIPAPERDRVFETGYSTERNGTGFGLGIVREIVDAHGWEIRLTEGSAGGARFEITGVECLDG